MQYPDVDSAFRALQDSVASQIIRIDPTAEESLGRMKQIERDLVAIDAELAELES